jgi:hypothetical protein
MFQKKKVRHETEKNGEIVVKHSGPVSVTKWSDKKTVIMISTYHSHETRTVTISGKINSQTHFSVA